MKSRFIHTVVLEGCDGVGKTTLLYPLYEALNYRFIVSDRGELSNLVFSKIYSRPFVCCQRHQPILYVLLTCDKEELKKRICNRGSATDRPTATNWEQPDFQSELNKIEQQDLYVRTAHDMERDYHVIIVDTTGLTIDGTIAKVKSNILSYCNSLDTDSELTEWNRLYEKGCNKLGLKFSCRANQPYINDIPFMSESTLQNGVYETYTDKSYPDNLIWMLGYDLDDLKLAKSKDIEFAYVINSKIRQRPEVYEYYSKLDENNISFLTSSFSEIPNYANRITMSRVFGNEFIRQLSRAKYTVYCSRDLAYLELQTGRLYESILADEIVFVDAPTDKDNKILKAIYGSDSELTGILRVTPETLIDRYNLVKANKSLQSEILTKQHDYFNRLMTNLSNNRFNKD